MTDDETPMTVPSVVDETPMTVPSVVDETPVTAATIVVGATANAGAVNVPTLDDIVPPPLTDIVTKSEFKMLNNTDGHIELIYRFLNENYSNDGDAYPYKFTKEYLKKMLNGAICLGISLSDSGGLIGFISAHPITLGFRTDRYNLDGISSESISKFMNVSFLCVAKQSRGSNLSKQLIDELKKLCSDYSGCVYNSNGKHSNGKPVSLSRWYHRPINVKKLIDVGFLSPLQKYEKHQDPIGSTTLWYRIPADPQLSFIRLTNELSSDTILSGCNLLNTQLRKYPVHQVFTNEEFERLFVPNGSNDPLITYVLLNDGIVTDLLSFRMVKSEVNIKKKKAPKDYMGAFSYYNVSTTISLTDLLFNAIILAKKHGADVYNTLDRADTRSTLEPLRFHDGNPDFLYRQAIEKPLGYRIPIESIPPADMGFISLF
jgi:glycylpeptide N-tetradecanoyltransferase